MMKRISISILGNICMLFLISLNAQIPNNGFENWVVDGNDNNPVDWETTNNDPIISVTPYTPAYMGDFSMRVATFEALNMTFPGMAAVEFAYSQRPLSLNACLKATVMPGDRVLLIISFYRGDSIIALPTDCTFSIDSTITDFTCLSFPVTYQTNQVPDSASIVIVAGSDAPKAGTEIIVDEFSFTLATHIEQENSSSEYNTINYPNPARNFTYIPVDLINVSDVKVLIWDTKGTLVHSYRFHSLSVGRNELFVNTSQLSNGIYLYSVRGKDFTYYSKMVIYK